MVIRDVRDVFALIDEYNGQLITDDNVRNLRGLSKTLDDVADELKEINEQIYKILIYDTESNEFEREFVVDWDHPINSYKSRLENLQKKLISEPKFTTQLPMANDVVDRNDGVDTSPTGAMGLVDDKDNDGTPLMDTDIREVPMANNE